MSKYFQVHNYFENMKDRVSIFSMNGMESIWWEQLRQVNGIEEREIV